MAIGPFIGTTIGFAINALIGRKAKKAAEKVSEEYYSRLGECFTVSQPGSRLMASIFLLVMFGGGGLLILLSYFNNVIEYYRSAETVWEAVSTTLIIFICCSPLIFIAIWGLLQAIYWRVEVYDDCIVYTSFTGKKTEFSFKDITRVKTYRAQTGKAIKVYVGGKKVFAADPACENYYVLLSRLENEQVPFLGSQKT